MLNDADSLFDKEKYTEAMEWYQRFFEEGLASSAMLLKMAYVADATSDYVNALYYLDLYYQKTGDRLAVGKIEELAKTNDLYGYQYSDIDYLMAIFSRYRTQVFVLIIGILLLLLVYSYRKTNHQEKPYAGLVIQSFFAALLLILVNFKTDEKAIIAFDQSLLRAGPSAGAEPVRIIEKGHRVVVLDYSEIWSKILWDGDEVFIRSSRIQSI